MKKNILAILLPVALCIGILILPSPIQAKSFKKFKNLYYGTWTNTYDNCGSTGQSGSFMIDILKMKKNGTITSATVIFSDGGDLSATGKIRKKKNFRLRLDYAENSNDHYVIKGKITKKKITGATYDHTSSYGCNWGGPIELDVVTDVG